MRRWRVKIFKNEKGKWCYSFLCNGRRVRKVVGLSKQECEAVACEARNRIKREGFGIKGKERQVFFEDFAREYLDVYAKQNKRSWRRDEASLKHLNGFFKGTFLAGITPELVEKYKAKRRSEVSPGTVNLELACLKTICRKAVQWGRLEKDPCQGVAKFKGVKGRERILDEDEMRRLLAAAGPQLKPVLLVAMTTGMRKTEILSLKWANVNLAGHFIFIEDSKSGRSRRVPISPGVVATLRALPKISEYLFFNPDTKSFVRDVKTAFHAACRRAKIAGLRFHDLRHTAFSAMVRKGVDLVTVSKIAGHASIQMTVRYSHPTPENMQRAVDVLGDIFAGDAEKSAKNSAIEEIPESVTRSYFDN
jgi:integrase